jgi:hypothetical protein
LFLFEEKRSICLGSFAFKTIGSLSLGRKLFGRQTLWGSQMGRQMIWPEDILASWHSVKIAFWQILAFRHFRLQTFSLKGFLWLTFARLAFWLTGLADRYLIDWHFVFQAFRQTDI